LPIKQYQDSAVIPYKTIGFMLLITLNQHQILHEGLMTD